MPTIEIHTGDRCKECGQKLADREKMFKFEWSDGLNLIGFVRLSGVIYEFGKENFFWSTLLSGSSIVFYLFSFHHSGKEKRKQETFKNNFSPTKGE